ncbi:DUF2079 domain-containing protein [Cohnella sp. LGH]|uniref:DUF2079 domain-containing protein n=1 Tax=Cohnella sp. LGH TaxID=1619153 RepID=UPI001ADC576D|nr:DUF2079 domain-containing protein [Cohnella sp. LGH]QTH42325.1 DUF2079 domain-containing protein [Cohnella sp. LGH]
MKKKEFYIVTLIFLLLAISLTSIRFFNWLPDQGDSAFLFDLTENIAYTGKPESGVAGGIVNYLFDKHYTIMPIEQFITDSLQMPEEYKMNFFKYHTYLFLYVVAPLAWLIPVDILLKALTVGCFVGIPYLLYMFMRRRGVSIGAAALFCVPLVSHPAWSQALQGQLYVDRFFMFFGLLFAILFTSAKPNKYYILFSALLAMTFTERTGLIAGLFAVGFVTLYWKKIDTLKYYRLTIGLGMIIGSALLKKLFTSYEAYNNFLPQSYQEVVSRLQNPEFMEMAWIFLLFNVVLMGFFMFFNWRVALLAFGTMLPNIIGNIGGAEKVGWMSHYHSNYYPFLAFAAATGFVVLNARLREAGARKLWVGSAIPVAITVCMGLINPYEFKSVNISLQNVAYNPFYKHAKDLRLFYADDYGKVIKDSKKQIQAAVPEGSVVTVPEGAMANLYKNRQVNFFPVGIEQADYAVMTILGKDETTGAYIYGGTASYLGPEATGKINAAIVERMKLSGYDFENPVLVGLVGIAVVKKIKP